MYVGQQTSENFFLKKHYRVYTPKWMFLFQNNYFQCSIYNNSVFSLIILTLRAVFSIPEVFL